MIHALGPRARRIFDHLQERIASGELEPGAQLPPHTRLAADFGVAPMTIRHVLARLEEVGLVSREPGRGTFVRSARRLAALVVASPATRNLLGDSIRTLGYRVISAEGHAAAHAALIADGAVGLVLCELGLASPPDDTQLIRALRQRWPRVPLAAVTASPASLAALLGTPECPVLLLPAPVRSEHLEQVLRMSLPDLGRQVHGSRPTRAVKARGRGHPDSPLEQIFQKLPDAALILDRATRRVVAWNTAAEALFGYATVDAVRLRLDALIPHRVRAEAWPSAMPTDDPVLDATDPVELPCVRADGREVWVEVNVASVGDGRALLVARERTAQRADRDGLQFHSRLLEAVQQAVVATNPRGHIVYWNRGAEQLYGWSAEEVLGRNAADVIVAPRLLERGLEIMSKLRRGESWSGEFPVRRRDGTELPVLVTDSPIRDVDGRLVGIIGVAVDLTQRKSAENDRLERTRLEARLLTAEAAQRELSQRLASNVPYFGRLASDPQLPRHLRPMVDLVLNDLREVASRLEHATDPHADS
jgi:PAS domain S-box-containing protein